jgi:hypothetical protein
MLRRVGSGGQRRAQTLGCTVYLRCRHALALSEGSAAYVFVITSARCKDCAVPDLIWEHAGQVYSATLDLGQGCVAAESPVSFYNSRTSLPSTAQLQLTQAPMTVQSEDDADQLTDVWVILAAGFFTSVFQQTWIAVRTRHLLRHLLPSEVDTSGSRKSALQAEDEAPAPAHRHRAARLRNHACRGAPTAGGGRRRSRGKLRAELSASASGLSGCTWPVVLPALLFNSSAYRRRW